MRKIMYSNSCCSECFHVSTSINTENEHKHGNSEREIVPEVGNCSLPIPDTARKSSGARVYSAGARARRSNRGAAGTRAAPREAAAPAVLPCRFSRREPPRAASPEPGFALSDPSGFNVLVTMNRLNYRKNLLSNLRSTHRKIVMLFVPLFL